MLLTMLRLFWRAQLRQMFASERVVVRINTRFKINMPESRIVTTRRKFYAPLNMSGALFAVLCFIDIAYFHLTASWKFILLSRLNIATRGSRY